MERNLKEVLDAFENDLEKESALISEAVSDVVAISKMNDEETARKLIRKLFLVVNRQDIV